MARPDPNATLVDGASEATDLAQKYLDDLSQKAWGGVGSGFEPTIVQQGDEAHEVARQLQHVRLRGRKSPFVAGLLSLFIPGGGFFYLGSWLAGLVWLFLVPISAAVFASYAQVGPLANPSLQVLPANWPHSWVVLSLAGWTAIVWWMGIMIPILNALRWESARKDPNLFLVFLTFWAPVLGPLVQQRLFLTLVQTFSIGIFTTFSATALSLWRIPGTLSQAWFLAAAFASASILVFLLSEFLSVAGMLRAVGILADRRSGAQTEFKFMFLGSLVIAGALTLALLGRPGQILQKEGRGVVHVLEKRGLQKNADVIQHWLDEWQAKAAQLHGIIDISF